MNESLSNFDVELCAGVVIGRNEGDRLVRCLKSLLNSLSTIVYVDSGSTDNSLKLAKSLGVSVVELDMSIPFTAARARNEGVAYLLANDPEHKYIQFVDGDCEVQPDWTLNAIGFLENKINYAVVCGRRRERYPERSIYNQLCDIEWDTPIGDATACGGDALIRVDAFKQVKGYRGDLIAGEEPEMCFRLRQQGWKIYRLDAEMTLHDAAMTKVSQWWNRAKRAGHAYAEGCYLHGHSAERFRVRPVLSILLWSLFLPIMIVLLIFYDSMFLWLCMVYPLQILRLTNKNKTEIGAHKEPFYYAMSNVFGKFPQLFGMMRFVFNKWQGQRSSLIEYK